MSRVQTLIVAEAEENQRLDRWLKRRFPQLNQGRIERMCRKGELRVDGGRARASARIMAGQAIRIPPLPPEAPGPDRNALRIDQAGARLIQSCVVYRDDHLLVLNKPPGLAVQGGSGQTRHVDALAPALRFERDENPRLVHRLDRDTSGVLLMARTRAAAATLTAAFRRREIRKIYWAIVAGVPHPRMGRITYGLIKAPGRDAGGGGERMLCVHPSKIDHTPGARHAHTDYAVLSNLGRRAAWMALAPITGRTHQLRAHMAGIGHPIIGDGKYGKAGQENPGDGWGAQLGEAIGHGLHLHARSLSFEHPVAGTPLTLTAPLPEHMRHTCTTVGWAETDMSDDPFEVPDDV